MLRAFKSVSLHNLAVKRIRSDQALRVIYECTAAITSRCTKVPSIHSGSMVRLATGAYCYDGPDAACMPRLYVVRRRSQACE
jgi:hypothetical protein